MINVKEDIDDTSRQDLPNANITAYNMSRIEQEATTLLGLFIQMIAQHVKEFGKLRMGDIIQYLTIADIDKIEENTQLVYKSFLMPEKSSEGQTRTRNVKFMDGMKNEMDEDTYLDESYKTLEEEGGIDSKNELFKVNPQLFRDTKYHLTVSPDILSPMSEDLEKQYNLEEYDRLIGNPMANQEEALRLLLGSYNQTKRDPDKYIMEQGEQDPMQMAMQQIQGEQPLNNNNNAQPAPNKLPQQMAVGKLK
jgi:hypothetical protein